MLASVKKKTFDAYNAAVDKPDQFARVIVIIDEMNTFVGLKGLTDDIHNYLALVASQGRACGIDVITATQHPEVLVIPNRIKTNMALRLSGAVPSVAASQVILDSPEASELPNLPGRFIARSGLDMLTVQVPMIYDDDIATVVHAAQLLYREVPEELNELRATPRPQTWDEQRFFVLCLDLLNGHLGPQKLHNLLGADSPGERHFKRCLKKLLDEQEAIGYMTRAVDGATFFAKRGKGGGYHATPAGPKALPVGAATPAPELGVTDEKAPAVSLGGESELTYEEPAAAD